MLLGIVLAYPKFVGRIGPILNEIHRFADFFLVIAQLDCNTSKLKSGFNIDSDIDSRDDLERRRHEDDHRSLSGRAELAQRF